MTFKCKFRDEISQVQKYLDLLLKEKKAGLKINAKDIGIIAPYRKQVNIDQFIIAPYRKQVNIDQFHWDSYILLLYILCDLSPLGNLLNFHIFFSLDTFICKNILWGQFVLLSVWIICLVLAFMNYSPMINHAFTLPLKLPVVLECLKKWYMFVFNVYTISSIWSCHLVVLKMHLAKREEKHLNTHS